MYRQHLGHHFSEGARLLWNHLIKCNKHIEDVRISIGAAPGRANLLMYGDRKPSATERKAIRKDFGVPVESWDAKPRRPFETPAARAESNHP